jgi:hypothetical protein
MTEHDGHPIGNRIPSQRGRDLPRGGRAVPDDQQPREDTSRKASDPDIQGHKIGKRHP